MNLLTLYDPFDRMQFNSETCFLCGASIDSQQPVPVFPEWLMQHYHFGEKQLLLLDKSIIQYKDLTIPCCANCREQHVAPLDQRLEKAHQKGLVGFKAADERDIYLWLAKMFYGILVRELLNEQNPLIKPEHAVGENPKMFTKFQSLFKLLQALRLPILFDDFTPFSLFILEVKETETDTPFEYRDELNTMMFSIKMGTVQIICHLLDNNVLQKALKPVYDDLKNKPVHPIQAAEFTARAYYAAYLFNLIPEYFERRPAPGEDFLIYDTLVDDITMPVFNPWEQQAYAKLLEEMWRKWDISRQQILQNPREPLSYIYDETGTYIETVTIS
ncbi:MAG: hypothetical protein COW65_18325 [Cytophagales bacterium CG18_big_fil_WC_8_21_14_2_50_42_9]|nr:MAG: hypothetical protein COW65_18325 [Cytophagales bacterium CG18_big_fil_WC_8_21_14_2_50_42_9]